MHEVGDAGCQQAVRSYEHAVLGEKFQPAQQAVQYQRRFSRPAPAHQQHPWPPWPTQAAWRGTSCLRASREQIYRELEQLVAHVIGIPQRLR